MKATVALLILTLLLTSNTVFAQTEEPNYNEFTKEVRAQVVQMDLGIRQDRRS